MATSHDGGIDLDVDFMWKTDISVTGNCPAMYRTTRDGAPGYVIQGKTLSAGTMRKLRNLGSDEDAVFVPADVIERIKNLP